MSLVLALIILLQPPSNTTHAILHAVPLHRTLPMPYCMQYYFFQHDPCHTACSTMASNTTHAILHQTLPMPYCMQYYCIQDYPCHTASNTTHAILHAVLLHRTLPMPYCMHYYCIQHYPCHTACSTTASNTNDAILHALLLHRTRPLSYCMQYYCIQHYPCHTSCSTTASNTTHAILHAVLLDPTLPMPYFMQYYWIQHLQNWQNTELLPIFFLQIAQENFASFLTFLRFSHSSFLIDYLTFPLWSSDSSTHFLFSSFASKTSSDSLKKMQNHQLKATLLGILRIPWIRFATLW